MKIKLKTLAVGGMLKRDTKIISVNGSAENNVRFEGTFKFKR